VLVVDDDVTIRSTVAEALELEGYLVARASNGAEALQLVRQQRPGAIVLDLMMPVMDGWTFLEHCRAEPTCHETPVLVISAYRDLPKDAATLGVNGCLAKPFDLDVLVGAVDRLVRRAA
jgi:two-component system, chemotaxis family, chemotaxis protein CheY